MSGPSRATHPTAAHDASCSVCAADVPPLIGSVLTGTGLTLDHAAQALLDTGAPPGGLTPLQVRLVEEHAARLDG